MQGINKTVAIGAALLLAVAAYAYGWHRGDSGQQPDLATDVSADEEGRKTYYPNTEKLEKNGGSVHGAQQHVQPQKREKPLSS